MVGLSGTVEGFSSIMGWEVFFRNLNKSLCHEMISMQKHTTNQELVANGPVDFQLYVSNRVDFD